VCFGYFQNLRRLLFGRTVRVFNFDWRKSFFHFREPNSELSYALQVDQFQGGARAVQMVIQARIIKHLLFSLTELGPPEQQGALAAALSDSLWLAGQEESATVTMVTEDDSPKPPSEYRLDLLTEKMHTFVFNRKEELSSFLLDHIHCFQEEGGHGVVLFLYSLVCSRTIDRIREDLDSSTAHLLQRRLGNFALLNLLLTGRATPHVCNGTQAPGGGAAPLDPPLQGVLSRGDIGYLHWSREQMDRDRLLQVGSMLKTPRFPVWLCCINSTYSVLFSLTRSLLSDWRTEHQFQLFYYNGQNSQNSTARLTITHSHHWEAPSVDPGVDLEKRFPSLEMTIRTKWEGASINWGGIPPFY
uniref:MINDY family member 4B n=1 Tax=Oryzias melastigma TaxID=30732 RepID=A0A3B3DP97_ORYME